MAAKELENKSKEELLSLPDEGKGDPMKFFAYLMFAVGVAVAVASFWIETKPPREAYPLEYIVLSGGVSWALWWGWGILTIELDAAKEEKKRLFLLEHGQFGRAEILESKTLDDEESSHSIKLRLKISLEGREPFIVKDEFWVPALQVKQVQVGSTVDILGAPAVRGVHRDAVKLLLK